MEKKPRILLAANIFYPDVGGPAVHVRKIAEALHERGYPVTVVTYSNVKESDPFPFSVVRVIRGQHPILRWSKYTVAVFRHALGAKVIYAFNVSAAGIPAFLAAKILGKKVAIRIPGDPIWERTIEKGLRIMPISQYYREGLHKKDRPWLYRIVRYILPRFDAAVTYTPLLVDIYTTHYGLPASKLGLIRNPVSRRAEATLASAENGHEPIMIFAGRFVAYKNLERVVRAFDAVAKKTERGRLLLIGDGPDREKISELVASLPSAGRIDILSPIPQDQLFEKIKGASFGIGPALTEFNPNFILECLSFGKPVLISRENGLSVKLSEEFLCNPTDQTELELKMTQMFDPAYYVHRVVDVAALPLHQTWDAVLSAHLNIIATLEA